MDWLEKYHIYILTQQVGADELALWLQVSLLVGGALFGGFFGGFFAALFRYLAEKRQQTQVAEKTLRSVSFKMLSNEKLLRKVQSSLFARVTEDTEDAELWKMVLPIVRIPEPIAPLASEEYQVLLELGVDVVAVCDQAISYCRINFSAVDSYSTKRDALGQFLHQHTVTIDPENQEIETEMDVATATFVDSRGHEINSLCLQLRVNLLEAADICAQAKSKIDEKAPVVFPRW